MLVDRWQYGDPARPGDPSAEAWAALLRAILCRRGAEQMRADADEAVRRFAAENFVTPAPALMQGIARVLCGDLDGGDASLEDAVSAGEEAGAHEDSRGRAVRTVAGGDGTRRMGPGRGFLPDQARTVLRRAGIEESYATPLVCAVQARAAMHRGDVPAARRELVSAQRLRPLLTYALPYFAVQARIELARVHLALADLAGARTLMREVDELLRRRPGLGNLAGEAQALRARLAKERGPSAPGASALTAAELRLLPLLSTHLSFPEIAAEMFLSRNTIKSQAILDLPEAGRLLTQPGGRPVPRAGAPGGLTIRSFTPSGGWNSPRHEVEWCSAASGERMGQTVRFQETLRRLAMIDEGFVEDQAGLGLGLAGTSALDPKTAALLQLGASVALGSPAVCLEWSAGRALAAGATEDEIADVLLAIAPVAGLGRVVSAAPDLATALGYDVAAALEEPDDH